MKVIPIFPTLIIKFNVDVPNTLVDYCLDLEKQSKGVQRSNVGGWQSRNDLHNDEYFSDTYFQKFLEEVSNKVDVPLLEVTGAWININRKGDLNRIHTHPGNDLALVWYIKTPKDCGGIIFENPTLHSDCTIFDCFSDEVTSPFMSVANCTFDPEEGQCYIFPASLRHYVDENKSDEDRISIAINLKIISGRPS